ncbi:hypothetical protein L3Y34_013847 [Caenorhabditis briggsae]|uniref:Uncharacterized protein n=1 Tax=Caenorhabditis briggsae TaxID=6238 RepID=A0AAE8ZVV6_CAEBR|nr:hypothetical protein L3Y34_013847 [Caenorhabditis briggsae]
MMFRILLAFCFFSTAASVTLVICQQYCSSVQGAASYDNCAPWNSYALASNQTCYNLCVHNCAAVYDGSCMTGDGFRSQKILTLLINSRPSTTHYTPRFIKLVFIALNMNNCQTEAF